jgi:cytochrome b6-f complex iron-sulfur subunit
MARLAKPRVSPDASSIFRLGQAEDFPPGSIIDLPAQGVRAMSTEAGIAVLSLVCTHLGCVVKPSEEGFGCPCHGSRFDIHGKVMGGPAPRPLRWLALSQTPDGTLLADKAQEVPPGQYLKA